MTELDNAISLLIILLYLFEYFLMSTEILIRPAFKNERRQAGRLAAKAFESLRPLVTDANWKIMQEAIFNTTALDQVGMLLVAVDKGRLVGSVRYTGPGHGGHPHYPDNHAYIRSVAVDPMRRGKGIGRKLTEACITIAQEEGAREIGLHVANTNKNAIDLYRNIGFVYLKSAGNYFDIPYSVYGFELSAP